MIIRTGRRIPGVTPVAGVHYPIAVVRMAVGDAYGAEQWREQEDGDEHAFRTERISRSVCRAVAEYSFRTADRIHGRVYGGPKWTVSPVYEGLLKEEMDAAAERHPEVPYSPVLIDATYAGLITGAADAPLVIPALNRDGDCLSDFVLPMFGSIAGAESVLLALDDDYEPSGRDGGGAARHRAGAPGQGHRQPDGDDPGRGRRCSTTRARWATRRPTRRRGRSTSRCSRRPPPACARPTSAGTLDDGVHGRGDLPGPDEDRDLGVSLALLARAAARPPRGPGRAGAPPAGVT